GSASGGSIARARRSIASISSPTESWAAWANSARCSRDEVLLQLRRAGRAARPPRRQPATLRLRPVRRDPLPESEGRRRHRTRVGWTNPAVPARDRAALRLLDAAGGIHGKQRD